MKEKAFLAIFAVVVLGGAVGAFFLVNSLTKSSNQYTDFQLETVEGTTFNISSLLQPHHVVLLDFMSVSCPPCKEMNTVLHEMLNDQDISSNLTIISIETDPYTTNAQLNNYKQDENITWALCKGPSEIKEAYGVSTIPKFVFISGDGTITGVYTGIVDFEKMKTTALDTITGEAESQEVKSYQGLIFGFAIVTGITSFFSPCAFPLMPGYIAHILGKNLTTKNKQSEGNKGNEDDKQDLEEQTQNKLPARLALVLGLFGGIGILISYLLIGLIITAIGSSIVPYIPYLLPVIGGIFLLLGIAMFSSFQLQFNTILGWIQSKQMKLQAKDTKHKLWIKSQSTLWYGIGYGLASLGCNAPIFLAFSVQVAAQKSIISMILAYAFFAGTILLLMIAATILIGLSRDYLLQKLKGSTELIKKMSGIILIAVAIYMIIEFFVVYV